MAKWRGSTPLDGPPGNGPGKTPLEAAVHAAREAEVHALVDAFAAAVRARDADALIALCAPDLVTFDLLPPIRNAGAAEVGRRWSAMLSGFAAPVQYEPRDLHVEVAGEVALAHYWNEFGGTRHDGTRAVGHLRTTLGLRRLDGGWRIVHEHVSVPVDMASGRALLRDFC